MNGNLGSIPFALSAAHEQLMNELDVAVTEYGNNQVYSNADDVFRCIERFVDALKKVGGLDELVDRAEAVKTVCATGSEFSHAIATAMETCAGPLEQLSGAQLRHERIRSLCGAPPQYLAVVSELRDSIEFLLRESEMALREDDEEEPNNLGPNLNDESREAYLAVRDICQSIQEQLVPREVDGCRILLAIYKNVKGDVSGAVRFDSEFVRSAPMGGAALEKVTSAANAMFAWATDQARTVATDTPREQKAPGQPTPDSVESDGAFFAPKQLATHFGVPQNALEQRLKRWRKKNAAGNGYIEVESRNPREPKYLYRLSSVRKIVESLAATSETTGDRPAKKK